jgi:hypothetical protein
MRIVPARNVLPLIGIAALVLVAATGSTFAKKARASAYTKSAHYYCVGAAALATAKRLRWSGASLVASHHKLVH